MLQLNLEKAKHKLDISKHNLDVLKHNLDFQKLKSFFYFVNVVLFRQKVIQVGL